MSLSDSLLAAVGLEVGAARQLGTVFDIEALEMLLAMQRPVVQPNWPVALVQAAQAMLAVVAVSVLILTMATVGRSSGFYHLLTRHFRSSCCLFHTPQL
jgi:hypothetical protein